MRFGDLELHRVSDGVVRADAGGMFGLVPRTLYSPHHPPAEDNTLAMALTSLLVRSRGRTILIDTGLGDKLTTEETERWGLERPAGGLLEGLAALGVGPDEIDIVINTHLHWDHCGGNTRRSASEIVPTFARARYLVQRAEWSQAMHPDARTRGTYRSDNFAPLVAQGRMQLLHGEIEVTDQVVCRPTPGHTRGHQSVELRAGEWSGLFLGDLASYAVHFAQTAWLTAYDVEPLETLRTKQRWQDWALARRAWLFFEHDAQLPVGRLARDGRHLRVEPVAEA